MPDALVVHPAAPDEGLEVADLLRRLLRDLEVPVESGSHGERFAVHEATAVAVVDDDPLSDETRVVLDLEVVGWSGLREEFALDRDYADRAAFA